MYNQFPYRHEHVLEDAKNSLKSAVTSTKPQPLLEVVIQGPMVPAIISINKEKILERKKKKKAELHKTMPCTAYKETGRCNYGRKCKFAHGNRDLRTPMTEDFVNLQNNNRNYRTAPCMKYRILGECPYGDHCSYIHEDPVIDLENRIAKLISADCQENINRLIPKNTRFGYEHYTTEHQKVHTNAQFGHTLADTHADQFLHSCPKSISRSIPKNTCFGVEQYTMMESPKFHPNADFEKNGMKNHTNQFFY